MNNIKLILTDIDGVWTDGGMIYSELGDELKRFHVADGGGVALLRSIGIPVGFITGEDSRSVERRAKKLNIQYVFINCKNKLNQVEVLLESLKLSLENVAYIGDDINDIPLLEKVGFSACPSNAPSYIKSRVDRVCEKQGGEGVFREFVEFILNGKGLFDDALNGYLNELKNG